MTKEEIIEIAKTCKHRTYFRTMHRNACHIATKNGWIDEILNHIPKYNRSTRRKKWSDDELLEVALQYNTIKELAANEPSVRVKICDRGLENSHFAHMKRLGNIANKYVYSIENPEKMEVYVGLTINPKERVSAHRSRNHNLAISFGHRKFNITKISKLMSAEDAQNTEDEWIKEYKSKGWCILNIAKAGALGRATIEIDKEEANRRTLPFKTLTEFAKKEMWTYQKSIENGWINDIGLHLKRRKGYSKESLRMVALNYKTRTEFYLKDRRAHQKAKREGWFDEICAHMPRRALKKFND